MSDTIVFSPNRLGDRDIRMEAAPSPFKNAGGIQVLTATVRAFANTVGLRAYNIVADADAKGMVFVRFELGNGLTFVAYRAADLES